MAQLVIQGGTPLQGTVSASGAKNSALPILAATILMDGESEIANIPNLADVTIMVRMLTSLGLRAEYYCQHTVKIWNTKKVRHIAPYDLVTSMRASFFVTGPLLAKTGLAKVPLPGGCSIGSRPIDIHLKAFKQLGAHYSIEHGFVFLQAKQLKGATIKLEFPSVGATENIMMAAALAEGETIIENAAQEPEIVDLGIFLNKSGACITGYGTPIICIKGVSSLKGCQHTVIPDRVEAGTLLIAGAITGGEVIVENLVIQDLEPLLIKMREAGCVIDAIGETSLRVSCPHGLTAVDIETLPFPGFPTDMQAQMMALLSLAKGTSVIKETIFENRYMQAHELMRMGANIRLDNQYAFVTGACLSGAEVKMTDLRAGAALVLAGLAAQGSSYVHGLKHLKRGYDNLPLKLSHLGAKIMELS